MSPNVAETAFLCHPFQGPSSHQLPHQELPGLHLCPSWLAHAHGWSSIFHHVDKSITLDQ